MLWNYVPFRLFVSVLIFGLFFFPGEAVIAAPPPISFEQALTSVRWDPEKQGPLIAVDPQHTALLLPQQKLTLADMKRASLRALAGFYDRKLVPLGSVTVLAPMTMVKIGPPSTPPVAMGEMDRTDPLRYLLAELKPEQWQQITSPAGLPVQSLTPMQQAWFTRIAPGSPTLQPGSESGAARRASGKEIAGSRLRLSRDIEVGLDSKDGAPGGGYSYRGTSLHTGTPAAPIYWLSQQDDSEEPGSPSYRRVLPNALKPSDVDLAPTGANADVLRRPISVVATTAPEGLTIGVLIQRAAKVTGWELYADPRVARLPVWVRTGKGMEAVRAGDLLGGLCLAVTGTFRRVGPPDSPAAYVLTDDREGIGTRIARIVEWEMCASVLAARAEEKAQAAIKKAGAASLVKYAPDDPFSLSPDASQEMLRRAGAKYGRGPYTERHQKGDDFSFPIGSLPSAYRQFAEQQARKAAGDPIDPKQLRTDRVRLEPTLYLALLLPDGGVVRAMEMSEGENWMSELDPEEVAKAEEVPSPDAPAAETTPAEKPLLASLPKPVALSASVTTEAEVLDLVGIAREYGFKQLWLQVPQNAVGKRVLAAALDAGKRANPAIPVWAVVSPLKSSANLIEGGGPDGESGDLNLFGETSSALVHRRRAASGAEDGDLDWVGWNVLCPPGDFLRVETPARAAARIDVAVSLATMPGLAGLALTETAPPGYGQFKTLGGPMIGWWAVLRDGGDFGYTPEMRLAYLRREGYDPLDLTVSGMESLNNGGARLPFFPDEGVISGNNDEDAPVTHWAKFRRARNQQFLSEIYAALRKQAPTLPLVMAERSGNVGYGARFWASWESAKILPCDTQDDAKGIPSKDPHTVHKTVYQPVVVPEGPMGNSVNMLYSSLVFGILQKQPAFLNPDYYIIDFRLNPPSKIREILRLSVKPL